MKKLSLLLLACGLGFSLSALAQEATPPADSEINKSFQREYVYLSSQRESLNRQRAQMAASFSGRTAKAKAQVLELQKKLTHLTAANDERHEELTQLERQKKDLQKRGTSLESTFKKATQSLVDFKKGLRFESSKDKDPVTIPEHLKLADLGPLFTEANLLLRSASRTETFDGYYLDEKDEIKKGQVTRLGRVAAFLDSNDGRMILGPSGTGTLKTLASAKGLETFVFDNLSEAAKIQRQASLLEKLADLGPILFLALMLLMVAGLFLVLVKI